MEEQIALVVDDSITLLVIALVVAVVTSIEAQTVLSIASNNMR